MDEKPTRSLAMQSKCHECTGRYADGKNDCQMPTCSLYPWMPYAELEPDLSWMKLNPKRSGNVTWEESSREISDDQREAMKERLQKAREKRFEEDDITP